MKYLEILRARLDELAEARSAGVARMEAVTAVAETEARSALSDAEEAEFVEARAAIEAVDAEVVSVRSRIAELEKVEAGRLAADEMQRSVGAYSPPNISKGRDPWDMSDVRFGYTPKSELQSRARAAIETVDSLDAADKEAAERRMTRHDNASGAFARRILVTGSPEYRTAFGKLMEQNEFAMSDGERRAVAEMRAASLTDASGGYAVPFTLDPTIIDTGAGSVNPFRSISTVRTTVTDSWNGVTSAGVTASWDGEAAQVSDDAPTLAPAPIPVHKAQMFVPFSIEIGMDWASMESDIRSMFNVAKDDLEATAHATGAGADQPTGVVTALAASAGGASLVLPTTAEAFAVADLYKVEEALAAKYRSRASWTANKPIYNKVRQFGTADSHALWERLGGGQPSQLLGYSSYESSAMDGDWDPAVTAANYVLILGDFAYYYIVDRVGLVVDLVPHLFGANQRPTGQRGLYAYWRTGADVVNDDAFRMLNIATTA